jgi:hypothetical protein
MCSPPCDLQETWDGRADLAGGRPGRIAVRDAVKPDERGHQHRRAGRHADPGRSRRGGGAAREWFGGYGQFTCLRHAAALATCYAHQSQTFVRLHELVRRGQRIGTVGCTGHCFGPHVHFEVHLAASWSAHERDVDPLLVLPRR